MKPWAPHPWTCLLLGDALGCVCGGGTPVWGRKLSYLISHLPSDWGSTRPGSILRSVNQELNDVGLVTYTLRASVKWGSHALPSLRASLQSSHEKTPGERRLKSWNHSPLAGFYFDSPLCGCLRQLPTSRALLPAASLCWRFILRKVLFSSLHSWLWSYLSNPLPGAALRCWQRWPVLSKCAACSNKGASEEGGRGFSPLSAKPHIGGRHRKSRGCFFLRNFPQD